MRARLVSVIQVLNKRGALQLWACSAHSTATNQLHLSFSKSAITTEPERMLQAIEHESEALFERTEDWDPSVLLDLADHKVEPNDQRESCLRIHAVVAPEVTRIWQKHFNAMPRDNLIKKINNKHNLLQVKELEEQVIPWLMQNLGDQAAHHFLNNSPSPLTLTVQKLDAKVKCLQEAFKHSSTKEAVECLSSLPRLVHTSPERIVSFVRHISDILHVSKSSAGGILARCPLTFSFSRRTLQLKLITFTRVVGPPDLPSLRTVLAERPYYLNVGIRALQAKRKVADDIAARHAPWREELLNMTLSERCRLLHVPIV
ncbi:hypothetical protein CEUSTIGMA_g1672.t1, partial [Chlamydomonas eustigma]